MEVPVGYRKAIETPENPVRILVVRKKGETLPGRWYEKANLAEYR